MFGSVNVPFLPTPANTASPGKLAKSRRQIRRTAGCRPPAFGGSIASGVLPGSARPLQKELTAFNERLLPIAARGGVKVSCGASSPIRGVVSDRLQSAVS